MRPKIKKTNGNHKRDGETIQGSLQTLVSMPHKPHVACKIWASLAEFQNCDKRDGNHCLRPAHNITNTSYLSA